MITNNALADVDTPEKLDKLFEAFGVDGARKKIAFLNKITHHVTGDSGVKHQDLQHAKEHFLKHEWQEFAP